MTLIMCHTSRDSLSELWDGLSSGWSAFGARPWTGQKARTAIRNGHPVNMSRVVGDAERFGVAALTRVVEATYGAPADGGNGWHLHIHALVFVVGSLRVGLSDLQVVEPRSAARHGQRPLGGVHEVVTAQWGDRIDWDWLARSIFAARVYERWSRGLKKAGCAMRVRSVSMCERSPTGLGVSRRVPC
jgi:hypothetical protein